MYEGGVCCYLCRAGGLCDLMDGALCCDYVGDRGLSGDGRAGG